jgi:glycosyltransferase involved in cell wall biosynthesis
MDLISVIISAYNRTQWLREAIESAIQQTYQPVEVIVVDDGSTNPEVQKIIKEYSQVTYLYQDNHGLGSARNQGITASSGNWIQFLDDDDWLTPDSLEQKYKSSINTPSVDVVYSDLYLCHENGEVFKQYYQDTRRPLPTGDIFRQLLNRNFIPAHALLWNRSTLEKYSGFPEHSGHEDWECLIKASMFAKFEYIDLPLGYYRQHPNSMSRNFDLMFAGKLKFQQELVESSRFRGLPDKDRNNLLCKFSLQQWGYGQPSLALDFLNQARQMNSGSILPKILPIWFRTGRNSTRTLIRLSNILLARRSW